MPDVKKQEYYRKNREERLQYQKDYYNQNREHIRKNKIKKMLSDPYLINKEKSYHREYYKKNKKRIMERRRNKRRSINRSL